MTDMLSQWNFKQQLCQPLWVSHNTATSNTMVAAQPMSWPVRDQPFNSCQEAHLSPMHKPRPQEVEASTQRSRSNLGSSTREHEGFGIAKVEAHHES